MSVLFPLLGEVPAKPGKGAPGEISAAAAPSPMKGEETRIYFVYMPGVVRQELE
jgi:hypothetical protein